MYCNRNRSCNHHAAATNVALGALLATTLTVMFAQAASAQTFPVRPVRYVMPLPAGSETDVFARTLARHLGDAWGQQVIVENRAGAGTTIATDMVAKAPADGHTFLHAITAHAVNATLYAKLPYDTLKDFAGVSRIANVPSILVVSPALGVNSVKDLVALAK